LSQILTLFCPKIKGSIHKFQSELKDKKTVTIQGEVNNPKKIEFYDKLTLLDLIIQADGLTDAASNTIEIARMVRTIGNQIDTTSNLSSTILKIETGDRILKSTDSSNILLMPFDVVTVRRISKYQKPETIDIVGEVINPGPYALTNPVERVSNIISRSGGFKKEAYPEAAFIRRYKTADEKEIEKLALERLSVVSKDTLKPNTLEDFVRIPLDFDAILKSPGSSQDIILRPFDLIVIPKYVGQIKTTGEVLVNSQIPFDPSLSFKSYVNASGGFSSNALKKSSYIVYPNGKASPTRNFLFVKFYPKVKPGSEIVIPKRRERKGTSSAEVIGIASALASLAGVVIAITRQ
jgi:protein involved in polysaccharide export with SLBB domain